jgi:hypothetical protein
MTSFFKPLTFARKIHIVKKILIKAIVNLHCALVQQLAGSTGGYVINVKTTFFHCNQQFSSIFGS